MLKSCIRSAFKRSRSPSSAAPWRWCWLCCLLLAAPAVAGGPKPYQVVAAHPLAAAAGVEVLERGGNAMDAAVAVQAVLTLVEPHESGIGGGGFLLYRDAASGSVSFFDGRETAPAAATPERFLLLDRWPMPFALAVVSGRAVGVPGLVPMLHLAHTEYGHLPWSSLFDAAIEHAETGVPMPRRMQRQLRADPSLSLFRGTRSWRRAGRSNDAELRSPTLAKVLRDIAEQGPSALQRGPWAEQIVAAASNGGWLPGDLTLDDLASYRPQQRDAVCGPYRQWTLCSAAPPSSGGVALLQALAILEHFDVAALGPESVEAWHLVAEASRLAFADRQQYLGDPDFVAVPVAELLAPDYLRERAALLDPDAAMAEALPGVPGVTPVREEAPPLTPDPETGTTHFSIVDGEGNALALNSSIEAPFGARRQAAGFLLNNQLTDFDLAPLRDGEPVVNAVAAGKRPRSSMSPTFVFDAEGELQLVIGSRGGSRIIGYVLKTLVAVLDWDLPLAEAIALPNILHRGQELELEAGTWASEQAGRFEALGHRLRVRRLESGLHGIERCGDGWCGAADPRMEGAALP